MVERRPHATGTHRSPPPTDPPTDPPPPRAPANRTACVESLATVGFPSHLRAASSRDERLAHLTRLTLFCLFVKISSRRSFRRSLFRRAQAAPASPAPLRVLTTTGLIDLYKRINRNYYETRPRRTSRGGIGSSADERQSAALDLETGTERNRRNVSSRVGSADAKDARLSFPALASRRRSHPLSSSAGGRLGTSDPMSQGRRGSHSIGTHSNADWDPTGPKAPRDLLHDRYAVGRVIGRGAFARVVVAYDIVTDARVAIKITRKASKSFHQRARKEIEILRVLGGGGGARGAGRAGESETSVGHPNVVTLLDHFAHRGESDALFGPEESFSSSSAAESGDPAHATRKDHPNPNDPEEKDRSDARADTNDAGLRCLVFELLSHSLYDVLRATSFRGVSLALVRKFSFQILHALSYLKSHGVVHLDLKPENVLLCSTDRSRVKLVDFGSSRWVNEKEETNLYAQSRFYRAAEVLLGLPCGCPADVWSLGCIMVELHGGKPLFPGRDERHQLAKIAETLGAVPEDMFAKASAERRKTHAHAAARRETDDGTLADADGPSADVRKQFATLGFVPKPHGSRPLRTVIAAASSAFEARQRERQSSSARGDDKLVENKRADAAATSMRALGLERDGEDFQSSRDFSRDDAFADAAETFSAEEARLTSVALFCDVVERFLTYAPELRAQPGTALEHPFFSADGAARGGFEALFFRGETMGETSFDEPFAGVDDEMLMYGLEGTDA